MFVTTMVAGCTDSDVPTIQRALHPVAAKRYVAEDNGCTDELCYDEPDYWGDDGWGSDGAWGDSWDSFGDNGSDFPITLFADEHDDTSFCKVDQNCHPYLPGSVDIAMFNAEVSRLLQSTNYFCSMLGQAAQNWMTHQVTPIQYYDDYIRTRNSAGNLGFLGGDTHPDNNTTDFYAGQVHIYKGSRSNVQILQTFRHEMGHVMGLPDGDASTSTDPFDFNGEQAATYCK